MSLLKNKNGGKWTEARFKSFIVGALRQATRKWGPIHQTKKDARVERGKYKCASCKKIVPLTKDGKKNVFVDHINPVVSPKEGFVSWDVYIERMFCEQDGLQVLCKHCHDKKSKEEREERKRNGI